MTYGKIYIKRLGDASNPNSYIASSWKKAFQVPFTKYNIKESDFRIKTATFTSPTYYDLTTGQYAVLFHSKYHENFSGIILDVEYDEETGLYNYQCQDWSRRYISKMEKVFHGTNQAKLYYVLRYILSNGGIPIHKATKKQKKPYKTLLSGLHKIGAYDQSLYKGNRYGGNPFKNIVKMIVRDKSKIEVIRSLVFNALGYYDVWFNDRGILQIEPISKTDWENTGLHIKGDVYNRKFKFSTTNAITNVLVTGEDFKGGEVVTSSDALGLDLSAFFGNVTTAISNPNNQTKSVKTSNSTSSTTANNKYGNPYNNKPKRIWVNADNGSDAMKNGLCDALSKAGWKVHKGQTWSQAHYWDYFNVTNKYSVYMTIYNGFCSGTIREAYSSSMQNTLKKKGVELVVVFDTRSWTDPTRKMKNYRYGDFTGANIGRAHDDNFSGSDPRISDVKKFFIQNKAKYCASPSVAQIMKQFNAGGYFALKGIKV